MKLASILKPTKAKTPWGGPSLPGTFVPAGANAFQDKYGVSKGFGGAQPGGGSLQQTYQALSPADRDAFDLWHAQNRGGQPGGFVNNTPPPANTRISPGVYADGRGGTILSTRAPGPVASAPSDTFNGQPVVPYQGQVGQQNGPFGPGDYQPAGSAASRYAPGAMPQGSTRGDAMRITPARGTRLSPGIYADGKGGSYRRR